VEGQERREKCERERERREGNGVGATGTVNVGTGSANVNIGCTAASAIVLGKAGGSVTLGPPLTLGAAPTTSGQLGGATTVSFLSGTLASGGFANTNSFSLPAGTYVVMFAPNFRPGSTSTVTIINIYYAISALINNGGTQFYNMNDAKTRQTMIDGTGSTYDGFQHFAIFTLSSAQATLYAGVQFNFTVAGASQSPKIDTTPGQVTIYRIA